MMQRRNTLVILLTSSLLAASCSKKDDAASGNLYTINRLTDVTLSQDTMLMPLDIAALSSGFHDSVSLALSGFPDGLSVFLDKQAGTAPFSTQLRFVNYYAPAGVYPLQLTATSKTGGTKNYQLTATVENLNGIRLDGVSANMYQLVNHGYADIISKSGNDTHIHALAQAKDFPGKEGTFTYKLVGINKKDKIEQLDADEMIFQLYYTDNTGTHHFNPAVDGQTIIVTASGDKFHLQCPHAVLTDNVSGAQKEFSMNVWNP
jgi:hypothetical protein